MTLEEFKDFVDRQAFRKAITAQKNPHEYIIRHKGVKGTDEEFVEAVLFIRKNGFKVMFWKKEYIVYYLDGHFYWTMGDKIENTVILNRNDQDNYLVYFNPREEGK